MQFNDITREQRDQLVDVQQTYGALRIAEKDIQDRFRGTMSWKMVNGREYLYHRIGRSDHSLGPRSPETETAIAAFQAGADAARDRVAELRQQLQDRAPTNMALRLGRVPRLVARILRRLDEADFLGDRVAVVGTNALFAYEATAGVFFTAGLLAADTSRDAHRRLCLATSLPPEGLIGMLRRVDRSFEILHDGHYRAVNRDGFTVDLITSRLRPQRRPSQRTAETSDLVAVDIPKLQWLIDAPRFEATAIGADGLPVTIVAVDPRYLAAYKLWLAERPDREPLQRQHDQAQGMAVASLLRTTFPHLGLSDGELAQLPASLRQLLVDTVRQVPDPEPPAL